jgi:putative Mg2+ transporter-C (MgtC) family protein
LKRSLVLYTSCMDPLLLTSAIAPYINLFLAALFGALIGIERTLAGKSAGMRTYALVSLGSCLFIIATTLGFFDTIHLTKDGTPLMVISGIISGVGFIGAGLIFSKEESLHGLTSAAGLWIAAGVGIASGMGLHLLSFFVTLLTLFIFTGVWVMEGWLKKAVSYPHGRSAENSNS